MCFVWSLNTIKKSGSFFYPHLSLHKWFYTIGENRFYAKQDQFKKIPGTPIAYWVTTKVINIYEQSKKIDDIADVKHGLSTGKNDVFVRSWTEVSFNKICLSAHNVHELDTSGSRYVPYNKGGAYKKWYGNIDFVLWYDSTGRKKMQTFSGHGSVKWSV